MRSLILAAVAALSLSGPVRAFDIEQRPYLDSSGRCHAADGQLTYQRLCTATKSPMCRVGVSKACGPTCIPLNRACHIAGANPGTVHGPVGPGG
ncbi:MAG TPA: hypothetical protein VGI95_14835 [Caulobacteraceae bacterium]|jgi:hypothetical protein